MVLWTYSSYAWVLNGERRIILFWFSVLGNIQQRCRSSHEVYVRFWSCCMHILYFMQILSIFMFSFSNWLVYESMYVGSVYQLVASSFSFIRIYVHVCMLCEVEVSETPQDAHRTFTRDISCTSSSSQHQRVTFMASLQCICLTLAFWSFVKADLSRDQKWNPMFAFLLYEFWNNKSSFGQIGWIINVNCHPCQKIWGVYKLLGLWIVRILW